MRPQLNSGTLGGRPGDQMVKSQPSETARPIEWTGDLDDDCTASWAGLTLRAEKMDRAVWWWAVYDDGTQGPIADSHGGARVTTGQLARVAAERAARLWVERHSGEARST
jgi:hypothetical protein